MLAKKEAHLEGQQQKLLAWAAELQRREAQLTAVQQGAPASPAHAGSSGVPQPIPSDSPLLAGRSLSPMQPAVSPQMRRTLGVAALAAAAQQGMLTPTAAAPSSGAGGDESCGGEGTVPATPTGPGEWTEEFEEVTAALPMLCCCRAATPAAVGLMHRVPAVSPHTAAACLAVNRQPMHPTRQRSLRSLPSSHPPPAPSPAPPFRASL
jgi:hypothetical protein